MNEKRHPSPGKLAQEITDDFIRHLGRQMAPNRSVAREGIRVGPSRNEREIERGKCIDLRPVAMMAKSGKGGPGHEELRNISLFEHSVNVASGAVQIAARDLFDEFGDDASLTKTLAVLMVVGFSHDLDKDECINWKDVSDEICERFADKWQLNAWLTKYGGSLSGSQLRALINGAESRTATEAVPADVSRAMYNAVRTYVRMADNLDGEFQKSWRAGDVGKIVTRWNELRKRTRNPEKFHEYSPIVIHDHYHKHLLDMFQSQIGGACVALCDQGPLLNVSQDGTLISLIPAERRDEILDLAISSLIEDLPLNSSIFIGANGGVKITGEAPTPRSIDRIVRKSLLTGDAVRLLAVKSADLIRNGEATLFNEVLLSAIADAGCTAFEKPNKTPMTNTTPRPDENDPGLDDLVLAAKIALALSVQPTSKSKSFKGTERVANLARTLDIQEQEFEGDVNAVSYRSWLAYRVAGGVRNGEFEDPFNEGEPLHEYFSPEGLFEGYTSKDSSLREAVETHFRALIGKYGPEASEGDHRCIITGLPVSSDWKVEASQKLQGLKSSAISYREGRLEDRFRETSDTHISPVTFIELKIREKDRAKANSRIKGIPVYLSSPTNQGVFGTNFKSSSADEIADFSTYDAVRGNASKTTLLPNSYYEGNIRIGRFEEIGATFKDRMGFFRRCLETSLRLGRPIHVFEGLPTERPEFFAADCLGGDLRALIGSDGIRIEQIPDAIKDISLLEFVAKSRSDGGLGATDLAKAMCHRKTGYEAACLSWWTAANLEADSHQIQYLSNNFIPRQEKRMTENGATPATIKLGRIARSIQKAPRPDDSKSKDTFLIRCALTAASNAYSVGIRGRDELVAAVGGILSEDTKRATSSSGGFYAAKANREEGVSIEDMIRKFSEAFVDEIWFGRFNGRPATQTKKRMIIAAYTFAFKHNS